MDELTKTGLEKYDNVKADPERLNDISSFMKSNPNVDMSDFTKDKLKYNPSKLIVSIDEVLANINNIEIYDGQYLVIDDNRSRYDEEFYSKVKEVLSYLQDYDVSVEIRVEKRSILNKSGILRMPLGSCKLFIYNESTLYTKREFIKEDQFITNLTSPFMNDKYSPFEKFMGIYSIVKTYKDYKDNEEDPDKSRLLKYCLYNDYMVCAGYARLLIEMLDKVGIDSMYYSLGVINNEELVGAPVDIDRHARVILSLDDNKYSIHGIYVSDPTWDIDDREDLYGHALMTYDSMQTASCLFTLEDIDLILDVHSFEEFNAKVNALLKRYKGFYLDGTSQIEGQDAVTNESALMNAYDDVYFYMRDMLRALDPEKEKELSSFYGTPFEDRDEKFYSEFFTKVGEHVVERSNNPVSNRKKVLAITSVTRRAHYYSRSELKAYKRYVEELMEYEDSVNFPYEVKHKDDYESLELTDKTR